MKRKSGQIGKKLHDEDYMDHLYAVELALPHGSESRGNIHNKP